MAVGFLIIDGSLTDDAYLTLVYARNVATNLHWGVISGAVANTATSPLNVGLIAAVAALTRVSGRAHVVFALGAETVGLAMVFAWGWLRVVDRLCLPLAVAGVGVAVALANPLFLSSIGLEVALVSTALILVLAMALEGRPAWFGVVSGLGILARPDVAVFAVLVGVATPAVRRGWRRAIWGTLCVTAPWMLFSWFYFGSAVPDSLVLKTSGPQFGAWTYALGPVMYLRERPLAVLFALIPAVVGLLSLSTWLAARATARGPQRDALRRRDPVAALGAGGLLYYGLYSSLNPNPYHWYYLAPTIALSACFVLMTGRSVASRARATSGLQIASVAVGAPLVLGALAVDAGQGLPWKEPVISTNRARPEDYARVGRELRARVGSAPVEFRPGETGTIAYYCRCRIQDDYSDRGLVIQTIRARAQRAPAIEKVIYELNYLWLDERQRPRPFDYRLYYHFGPARSPATWGVWSSWTGAGHLTLERPTRRLGNKAR